MNSQDDANASSNEVNDAKEKGSRRHRGGHGGRSGRGHAHNKGGRSNGREGGGKEKDNGAVDSSPNVKEGDGKQDQGGRGRGGRGRGHKHKGGRGSGGRGDGAPGSMRSARRRNRKVSDEKKAPDGASPSAHGKSEGVESKDKKPPSGEATIEAAAAAPNQKSERNKGNHHKRRSHAKSAKKGENKGEKTEPKEIGTSSKNEHKDQPKEEKRGPPRRRNARKNSQRSGKNDEAQNGPKEETEQKDSKKDQRQNKNAQKNSKRNGPKTRSQTLAEMFPSSSNSNDQVDTNLYFEQPTLEDLEMLSSPTKTRKKRRARSKKVSYPDYIPLSDCLSRYGAKDPILVRGTIRVLPKKDSMAFVSCDRGSLEHDVMLCDKMAINRAMDGDRVFVEILPLENGNDGGNAKEEEKVAPDTKLADYMEGLNIGNTEAEENQEVNNTDATENEMDCEAYGEDVVLSAEDFEDYDIGDDNYGGRNNEEYSHSEAKNDTQTEAETWQDDQIQMSLWNPSVKVRKAASAPPIIGTEGNGGSFWQPQRSGRVVCVIPPKGGRRPASELRPADDNGKGAGGTNATDDQTPRRTIVGTIGQLPGDNNSRYLFTPNNKSLPQFLCPANFHRSLEKSAKQEGEKNSQEVSTSENDEKRDNGTSVIYKAEYKYGTWKANMRWPPCSNVKPIGGSCDVEGETTALLAEFGVDHGDFEAEVLRDVEEAVRSGREKVVSKATENNEQGAAASDLGWKPTPDMYKGRRDYREERIFTIDPTTAKDLDDALHIKPLPDGRVEIGVHIADVSHFVAPDTAVDVEAMRRATTVYLVDRTIPMLPRPLCEIACSLNENVERLAFSCVWRMNMDGTMKGKKKTSDDVWYGRTVIKSCARLDYATAQNIIEGKVANGEKAEDIDVNFWPQSRQPTGGHTIDEVAGDVRLMHRVAQARRALRFQNGALALNGVKLAFQLGGDGEAPELCEPYPIRDSNRLVEEYMLLANYLVAERLIAYAGDRALLRNHPPPLQKGLENVVDVARESVGFHIDASTSQSLQESLSRMGRECNDELVMQCVTELAMVPMQPAQYLAAGNVEEEQWRHFALNIPYYTHFTSPIRRYPDVMVHRLLQATIDDTINEDKSLREESEIQKISEHCNEKRMASKKAQERSDRVFLSLFLRAKPIQNVLGVVLSVGEKTFTVFVPSLGLNTLVFVDEHKDRFDVHLQGEQGKRQILLQPKDGAVVGQGMEHRNAQVRVKVFAKLKVSCYCKEKAPIDVKVLVEGNWKNN